MSAPAQPSPDDYEKVSRAAVADVKAAFPEREFDLKVEFLDRTTAQVELVIRDEGEAKRVLSHLAPSTLERIFARRKELSSAGFRAWQSMTISVRATGQPGLDFTYLDAQ